MLTMHLTTRSKSYAIEELVFEMVMASQTAVRGM